MWYFLVLLGILTAIWYYFWRTKVAIVNGQHVLRVLPTDAGEAPPCEYTTDNNKVASLALDDRKAVKKRRKTVKTKREDIVEVKKVQFDPSFVVSTTQDSPLCKYGDSGLIYPKIYVSGTITLTPYQDCSQGIRNDACTHIYNSFRTEIKLNDKSETNNFITKNFSNGDIFYVLCVDDMFIGTVALDTKNFYPCVSNMYVVEDQRKKGYGQLMLDFAIIYAIHLKFHELNLWCKKDMVSYYEKFGYEIVEKKDDLHIMKKLL